jgi:hypothetical protein
VALIANKAIAGVDSRDVAYGLERCFGAR